MNTGIFLGLALTTTLIWIIWTFASKFLNKLVFTLWSILPIYNAWITTDCSGDCNIRFDLVLIFIILTPLTGIALLLFFIDLIRNEKTQKFKISASNENFELEDFTKTDPNLLGKCPNCEAVVRLLATECLKCHASFDSHSAWKPKPFQSPAPSPSPTAPH